MLTEEKRLISTTKINLIGNKIMIGFDFEQIPALLSQQTITHDAYYWHHYTRLNDMIPSNGIVISANVYVHCRHINNEISGS